MRWFGSFAILLFPFFAKATIPYRVTVSDPDGLVTNEKDAVLANLDAAIADWSRVVASQGELWINIKVTTDVPNGRFGGTSTGAIYLYDQNGFHIFEWSGTHKMRTGMSLDESKPDIEIELNPVFMHANYWIDPQPSLRTLPVPSGKVDLVTVLAHELGHGFGIEGWIDLSSGAFPASKGISKYDSLVKFNGVGEPVFSGANSVNLYGVQPPITFFSSFVPLIALNQDGRSYNATLNPQQNFYHLGRFSPDEPESDLSFFSLMSGSWEAKDASSRRGWRIFVNPLDAAVLIDIGVPPSR